MKSYSIMLQLGPFKASVAFELYTLYDGHLGLGVWFQDLDCYPEEKEPTDMKNQSATAVLDFETMATVKGHIQELRTQFFIIFYQSGIYFATVWPWGLIAGPLEGPGDVQTECQGPWHATLPRGIPPTILRNPLRRRNFGSVLKNTTNTKVSMILPLARCICYTSILPARFRFFQMVFRVCSQQSFLPLRCQCTLYDSFWLYSCCWFHVCFKSLHGPLITIGKKWTTKPYSVTHTAPAVNSG